MNSSRSHAAASCAADRCAATCANASPAGPTGRGRETARERRLPTGQARRAARNRPTFSKARGSHRTTGSPRTPEGGVTLSGKTLFAALALTAAAAVPAGADASAPDRVHAGGSPLPPGACVTHGAVGLAYEVGVNCRVVDVDGHPRRFIVYVPATAPVTGPRAPVVFMFHGSTGTGEQFLRISGWREQADATGLVAVFPTGLRYRVLDSGRLSTKWNDYSLASQVDLSERPPGYPADAPWPANDVGFVDAMMADLGARLPIDRHRVYASGFSNGAGFTARLAVERSTVLAAAAFSGGALPSAQAPARPIPMYLTVGTLDDRVLAQTGPPPLARASAGPAGTAGRAGDQVDDRRAPRHGRARPARLRRARPSAVDGLPLAGHGHRPGRRAVALRRPRRAALTSTPTGATTPPGSRPRPNSGPSSGPTASRSQRPPVRPPSAPAAGASRSSHHRSGRTRARDRRPSGQPSSPSRVIPPRQPPERRSPCSTSTSSAPSRPSPSPPACSPQQDRRAPEPTMPASLPTTGTPGSARPSTSTIRPTSSSSPPAPGVERRARRGSHGRDLEHDHVRRARRAPKRFLDRHRDLGEDRRGRSRGRLDLGRAQWSAQGLELRLAQLDLERGQVLLQVVERKACRESAASPASAGAATRA